MALVVPHTFRFVGSASWCRGLCRRRCQLPSRRRPRTAILSPRCSPQSPRGRSTCARRGPSPWCGVQRVGFPRPLACNLPRSDRCRVRPRCARGCIRHSDPRRATLLVTHGHFGSSCGRGLRESTHGLVLAAYSARTPRRNTPLPVGAPLWPVVSRAPIGSPMQTA